MKKLKLISPIPPSINRDYLKPRVIRKNNKVFPQMFETTIAKKYKKDFEITVAESIQNQKWKRNANENHHYYADAVFYFPQKGMDANNYWKCLLDAITDTNMVWKDDSIVCERVMMIVVDKENPRVELSIYPVDYFGIFKNENEKIEFDLNCQSCTRYTNGRCSILQKCLQGYLCSDVQRESENKDLIGCLKYKTRR